MTGFGTVLAGLAALFPPPGDGEGEDVRRKARAILAEYCYDCHGPDAHSRKAKLRLDLPEGIFGKRNGPAIVVPGSPDASELFARVSSDDRDERMPPAKTGRKLDAGQVALLRKWIEGGAPFGKHWSFVRPERTAPPRTASPWVRNPVDAFVLAKLESRGLAPSPEAEPRTLLRRLSIDLLGLPPSLEEADLFAREWAAGPADAVVARWVDQLLASPHFGERWGRHWRDLARYADSDGYEVDRTRPDAWRFRDWVVGAVNGDLPFDRFTVEQLAGDLLPEATPSQKTAAGFHRMAAFNRIAVGRENEEEFRVKHVKERVNVTATVWLGLTLGCAECHDHKYDPLPQRDFYRFYAFFNSLDDAQVPAPPLPERHAHEYEEALKEHEQARAELKIAKTALDAFEKDVMPSRMEAWSVSAARGAMPADVAAILDLPPRERQPRHLDRLGSYFRTIDPEYLRLRQILQRSENLANNKPDPPSTQALTVAERAERRPTFLQVRGNFEDRGEELSPGLPGALPGAAATRLELARWIADPAHPLTARVAVNHAWKHLFGQGLVGSPENFGAQGEPPSHPELLDWLAVEFVEKGWSRKALLRTILTSATYRQASRHRAGAAAIDPENRLLWRQNRLRVEAEIVRDLGLAAGGLLDPEMGGPSIQPALPASLLNRTELGSERLMMPSRGRDRYRRGLYVNVQRTFPFPMLKGFDAPEASDPCPRRDRSVSPQQALTLLNDPVFAECAVGLGLRVVRECAGDASARADHAFRLCFARRAGLAERRIVLETYEAHRAVYGKDAGLAARLLGDARLPEATAPAEAAAWAAVGRALLNTDEFITRE